MVPTSKMTILGFVCLYITSPAQYATVVTNQQVVTSLMTTSLLQLDKVTSLLQLDKVTSLLQLVNKLATSLFSQL
jgi:hypothetical protein